MNQASPCMQKDHIPMLKILQSMSDFRSTVLVVVVLTVPLPADGQKHGVGGGVVDGAIAN